MEMEKIRIGAIETSRFILGTNPVAGVSHQSPELNSRMRRYFSSAQVKRLFREAEGLGVNTVIARTDNHIIRLLEEYWDEGGQIQWIAQTAPELISICYAVQKAIENRALGCFIHGGVADHLLANDRIEEVIPAIKMIREAGLAAGIAGHNPEVFLWAERNLELDFYMCCYYNPSSLVSSPQTSSKSGEWFSDADRQIMVDLIAGLSRPAIHYKIMAAGRNDPAEAFGFTAKHLRTGDAVCVGIYDEAQPGMLRENVELLESCLRT